MIIAKLMGGLGNQMFQYAFARAIANKHKIAFDLTSYLNSSNKSNFITSRNYELEIFTNIKTKKIPVIIIRLITSRKIFKLRPLFPNFLIKILNLTDENASNYYQNDIKEKICLVSGYFQDPKYFNHIRPTLIDKFKFPEVSESISFLKNEIISVNAVSIHVRRGDYLKSQNIAVHGILPISYYNYAIELIAKKTKNPKFFVFSDDINWCKENFNNNNSVYFMLTQSEPVWTDMYLMSICKHNIIANSSYSWWSAWLNQNNEKLVIAPREWFVHNDSKICLDTWIMI
ncbi:alpha-1,2-fucosyltransferase [Pedobacter sp. Leaf250]|uniref:alpha-1,2-fucosyltransferase n=1 Tax=Pedobacter sp. Leaf250 TaxID=2876559 RepID=UPI001E29C553|nr:alpha-1,2-fucosyltransferase [Pedobacter sp. Leaf250]